MSVHPTVLTPAVLLCSIMMSCSMVGACSTTTATRPNGSEAAANEDLRALIARARDRVFPALVNISVVTVDYYGGREHKGVSVGSGTIIDDKGHVLTNAHVVNDGRKFRVTLADKQEVPATLVGEDPLTDLAILKIDLSKLAPGTKLAMAELADSSTLQTADNVLAMGSPWGLSRSVTLGIVSNTQRVFSQGVGDDAIDAMQEERGERYGLFTQWIQHDAAINPGNSGGPLVNLQGQVVGVNTLGNGNMGFASPSNLVKDIAAKLIANGEVPRSWIGATFKQIGRTSYNKGVLVTSVISNSPAAMAGLKAGDLVTSVDGADLTVRFPEEVPPLLKLLADRPIGSEVTLAYERGGVAGTAKIKTEKLYRDRGDETLLRGWGLVVREITDKIARDRRLESKQGALVGGVRSGSPAALAEPGLTWGDVIKRIDDTPVSTLKDVVERYREIMKQEKLPEFVLVEFDRQGKNQVTLIKPRQDKQTDPPREVPKAWIGVATQPITKDLASKLGVEGTFGFRVTRIYPGTKAASSGIAVGDIITTLGNEKVTPKGPQDAGLLQRTIRKLAVDAPTTLTVVRGGKPVEIALELERTRPGSDEARKAENKDFELSVRELTFFDRDDERWDDSVQGVMVDSAEQAGWAGLAGISSGDLIQQIQGTAVTSIDDFRKAMETLSKAQPAKVEFVVLRDNRTFYKFAEPDWKPTVQGETPQP
jgi:serine protease Do